MQNYSADENRGVAIGCNYSLKLMREANLIPEGISRLEEAIEFILENPPQQFASNQVEAMMNAAFYLGAESGLMRCFERIRDRTFVVNNKATYPRVFRNTATTTTQFSFTQYVSEVRLNCRVHIPDAAFDGLI